MKNIENPQVYNKVDFCKYFNRQNKPVIFWDTCSLLDIVRLPVREDRAELLTKIIETKNKIVDAKLLSVASTVTITEWNQNIGRVEEEFEKYVKTLNTNYNNFIKFVNEFALTKKIPPINFKIYKLSDALIRIAQTINSKTLFIDYQDFLLKATQRLLRKAPPAEFKNEYKDCLVWETCLEVRNHTRNQSNFWGFITSNSSDYMISGNLHPAIDSECKSNSITFLRNWDLLYKYVKGL